MHTVDSTDVTLIQQHMLGLKRSNQFQPIRFTEGVPLDPIYLGAPLSCHLDHVQAEVLRCHVRAHGYAIVQVHDSDVDTECITLLAQSLGLGKPFTPVLYSNTPDLSDPIVTVRHRCSDGHHPIFHSQSEVPWHTDGTLEPIGHIPTTIIQCRSPARSGGRLRLFNATGAYYDLLHLDFEAAITLAMPSVLTRQSTLDSTMCRNVGPLFKVNRSHLITAYSLTPGDRWCCSSPDQQAAFNRAVAFFKDACALHRRKYVTNIHLDVGQAIVFANSQIAHARESFEDDPVNPRCMYRGLFCMNV